VARAVIRWKFADDSAWYGHGDPRVRAVVASVPWAANFDLASLQAPRVPLGLVEAGQDRWLRAEFHVGSVRRACTPCETVASLPDAGHGAMLSPLPPDIPANLQPLLYRALTRWELARAEEEAGEDSRAAEAEWAT